jgi:hypothetical protein
MGADGHEPRRSVLACANRVFIEYRNPVGIAQRDGVRDEEIQTFTPSGSVEDLDQVRDSAGRPLR